MRRGLAALGLALALLLPALALASGAETYAGPRYWMVNESGGSSFSSAHYRNTFAKDRSGMDTTVTFIDNVSYGWHSTVRNTSSVTETVWYDGNVKKGHCRAHVSHFNGSCYVVHW